MFIIPVASSCWKEGSYPGYDFCGSVWTYLAMEGDTGFRMPSKLTTNSALNMLVMFR